MKCLHCEKKLSQEGRSHRLFCNSACRTQYHNERKKEENDEIKKIQHALKRNWKIMKEHLGDEKYRIVEKDTLKEKGFDFNYHTHHYKNRKGEEYIYCFNYGLREGQQRNELMLVKSFKD